MWQPSHTNLLDVLGLSPGPGGHEAQALVPCRWPAGRPQPPEAPLRALPTALRGKPLSILGLRDVPLPRGSRFSLEKVLWVQGLLYLH